MQVLTVEYRINIPRRIVSKIVHIPEAIVYKQTEIQPTLFSDIAFERAAFCVATETQLLVQN
jgi:hypothetical protein